MVGWEGKDKIGWLILAIWIVKMEGNTAGQVFITTSCHMLPAPDD